MEEAPNAMTQFSINAQFNEKVYSITLSKKENSLLIKSEELNSIPIKRYEQEFSKSTLNQISKFFKMFDDVTEFLPELKKRIEEKKIRIEVEENNFDIFFNVEILNIKEFCLELKQKEEDLKSVVNGLCKIINELNNKIKDLEEEKIKSNNKMEELQKKIKYIEEKLLPLKEEKEKEEKIDIFKESKIIKNAEEKIMLSNWVKPNSKIKFTLLYQVSRDGDRTATFHNKVNGKAPTLTLVKTKAGYKCGGYTSIIWDQSSSMKKDELAFVFSLDKKKKYTIKSNQVGNGIQGYTNFFAFGGGSDLYIQDQYTTKQ